MAVPAGHVATADESGCDGASSALGRSKCRWRPSATWHTRRNCGRWRGSGFPATSWAVAPCDQEHQMPRLDTRSSIEGEVLKPRYPTSPAANEAPQGLMNRTSNARTSGWDVVVSGRGFRHLHCSIPHLHTTPRPVSRILLQHLRSRLL